MKILTKKWFEIFAQNQAVKKLSDKCAAWLDTMARASLDETELLLKSLGKKDLDGFIESEILQIYLDEKNLTIKQQVGKIVARKVVVIENELGDTSCEKMCLRALEIFQKRERFELHFLIEKNSDKELCYLTISRDSFEII